MRASANAAVVVGGAAPDEQGADPAVQAAAVHEAGHAVAYLLHGRRFRYVTIRPRSRGLTGQVCVRPRRIDPLVKMVIAYAGPVAEAIHLEATPGEFEPGEFEFDDCLLAVLLTGGDGDYGDIEAAHEAAPWADPEMARNIAERLIRGSWAAVERLAAALVATGTAQYADALTLYRQTLSAAQVS